MYIRPYLIHHLCTIKWNICRKQKTSICPDVDIKQIISINNLSVCVYFVYLIERKYINICRLIGIIHVQKSSILIFFPAFLLNGCYYVHVKIRKLWLQRGTWVQISRQQNKDVQNFWYEVDPFVIPCKMILLILPNKY